jgi:NAD(P)-dependent dehydrogenase (short-subunit alcohol dehydrogenase family)
MLHNKVVFLTGGAGLIGKSFVKTLVQNHAIVIIGDINIENANKIKDKILMEFPNGTIETIQLDITDKNSIVNAINFTKDKYSKIDTLINNAYPRNKNYGRHFFDVSYEDFNENIGLNLGGYFLTSQQFALFFKQQGYGNIINISSIYGVIAPKFEIYDNTPMSVPVEYAAIKSALIHLTKYMAKYFKGYNIRVNAISPGGIFDNQHKTFLNAYNAQCSNKGMLNPEDLSGALVFLVSDSSQYVNGQNIIVDDGFTI